MTLSLGELASAMGLAVGLLGLILAALLSRGNHSATFGGGAIGALIGFAIALNLAKEDEGAAKAVPVITKTYTCSYHYFTHTDWAWIICTPIVAVIVVAGALAAYWMRLRFGPRGSQQTANPSLPPPPKRIEVHRGNLPAVRKNPFEDWRRGDG